MSIKANIPRTFSSFCTRYGCDEGLYAVIENDITECGRILSEAAALDGRIECRAFFSDEVVLEDLIMSDRIIRRAVFRVRRKGIRGAVVYSGKKRHAILKIRDAVISAELDSVGHAAKPYILHGEAAEDYLASEQPFVGPENEKSRKKTAAIIAALLLAAMFLAYSLFFLKSYGGVEIFTIGR